MQHYLRYKLCAPRLAANRKRLPRRHLPSATRAARFWFMLRHLRAIAVWRSDRTQANTR